MAATSPLPRLMGCAQGIRSPLYRRNGQKVRRGDHPHAPRVADAIETRNPTVAHDAMYLHLVYNRNMIAEGTQTKGI